MPDAPKAQDKHQPDDKRLTPTDIAQFIRLGECSRYLKLRLHERKKGSSFLREYGVAPQAIPPLLTRSGQQFEERVERTARERFTSLHCGDHAGGDGEEVSSQRNDNQIVVDRTSGLQRGETLLLFQPRLQAHIGDWPFVGDMDILRLDRDPDGDLSALIVDMKASTSVKFEHRLQVAFYQKMLLSILKDAGVVVERVNLGIVYRGTAPGNINVKLPSEEESQRVAAWDLLGVPDALLEIIENAEDYLYEVEELVIGPEAVIPGIARVRQFADLPWHLSYRCDGCLYQEFCMRDAFQHDDLSLIPTLTGSEKRTLHGLDLWTVAEVASLLDITDEHRPRLMAVEGREVLVRALQATSLGSRLHEIVHRAKQVTRARQREIEKTAQRRDHSAQELVRTGIAQ